MHFIVEVFQKFNALQATPLVIIGEEVRDYAIAPK
jgi:hypothetical protein